MIINWRQLRLAVVLLLMVGAMLPGTRPAGALEPGEDYWFVEQITLAEVVLPPGVVIRASDPAAQPRVHLVLENQTKTLLYVLSLSYKDGLVMPTHDPSWVDRVNLAHEVASYLVAQDHPVYLDLPALADLDQNLVDHNVLTYHPPADQVPLPAAQTSELLLVYAGQVLVVPFTVTYTLNTNFAGGSDAYPNWMADTQSPKNASATATQQAEPSAMRALGENTLIVGLVEVAVLLILGWLVWRAYLRRE